MPSRFTDIHTRFSTLDGMRGIAAISVMLFHYTTSMPMSIFRHAPLAVDIFFILSGFVIAHSYGNRLGRNMTAPEYLLRRIIRLYPMFVIGLLAGSPILYLLYTSGLANYSTKDIINALLCNCFFMPYIGSKLSYDFGSANFVTGTIFPVNPPAWSLFFEMVASILFVLFIKLKQKHLIVLICVSYAFMIISGYFVSAENGILGIDLQQGWITHTFIGGFPRVVFGFFLGVLVYSVLRNDQFRPLRCLCQQHCKSAYPIYILLFVIFIFPKNFMGLYDAIVIAIVAPSVVFAGALINMGTGSARTFAEFLGWISYPVYCLHWPIGRAVFFVMSDSYYLNLLPAAVASVATLAASVVLTKYCDEPIRGFLSKRLYASGRATR